MARIGVLGGTFAATWMIAATVWAQSAQIQGRLVDEQGGVLPGAEVSAMDEEGFGGCTNTGECAVACPKGIPLQSIATMNREFLRAARKAPR